MSKKNIDRSVESRVCFEQLEEWVREQIQFYVQELLEDEVTQLLGRRKNERRREVDAPGGYRNGYGKERRLTLSCGTIKLRRPRVRDLEERFESRVLRVDETWTCDLGNIANYIGSSNTKLV